MPFIVLEGLDGAGKSTQIKNTISYLENHGKQCRYIHFPRFDSPVYGDLIARFLRGEFGSADEVNPYLVALIYAGDRSEASPMISEWLDAGIYVIIDRYVISNIAYQCAKIDDEAGSMKLRDWINDLEYHHNKIPVPDLSIFLDVPFNFTEKKLTGNREGEDRQYLHGKKDIHEASLDLQQRVRSVYLRESVLNDNLKIIDCSDSNGNILPPDDIFVKIKEKISTVVRS
ncbi:MAG: dTMP kinase [Rikenellaceae bacterium]|nr:dTMP kinase [Rikenellaceae bacterium]